MIRRIKIIMVCIAILALAACSTVRNGYHTIAKKSPNVFRVISYNVNWGEGTWKITAPQETIQAIRSSQADVVLLQETTKFWQAYMKQHLSKLYKYQIFKNYPRAGGLAVLSKYPVVNKLYIHPQLGWHPGWIFDVKAPFGTIQFVNLHLTPPLANEYSTGFLMSAVFSSPPVRLAEMKFFYQHLNHDMPTIVAGDFNEGDRGAAALFLPKHGFRDALQFHHVKGNTWAWTTGLLTFQDRFDRIYYNNRLTAIRVQIVHEGNSDHYPVLIDFLKRITRG